MHEVDEALIVGWLAGRSVARGLPLPIADRGGWRVDSGQPTERCRYVFAHPCEGLVALGEAIDAPLIAIKLCRPNDELFALLPSRWRLTKDTNTKVMLGPGVAAPMPDLPPGYRLSVERSGAVSEARIVIGGQLAASGFAAEHDGVFVYDRIVTDEAHQRRGLGRAVMAALGSTRRSRASREILTATPAGRALYLQLGWADYSPYSTAMIP